MEQTEGPGFCSKVRNFTIVTAECEAEPEALLSGDHGGIVPSRPNRPLSHAVEAPAAGRPGDPGAASLPLPPGPQSRGAVPSVCKHSLHVFIPFPSCWRRQGQAGTHPRAAAGSGTDLFPSSRVRFPYARPRQVLRRAT